MKRGAGASFATQRAAFKRGRSAPWVPRAKVAAQRGRRAAVAAAGVELKFHDLDVDVAATATAGVIAEDSCVTIPQNTTESGRIGRKCVIRAIGWRWNLVTLAQDNTQSGSTAETTRVILYQDKQTNGATAAVTDLLESADYQSFNQLANKGRFRVLMDRSYTLSNSAGCGDGSAANDWAGEGTDDSFFLRCNIPIEYDNSVTTGAIESVRTNNIGVLVIGNGTGTAMGSKMRLRFSDG